MTARRSAAHRTGRFRRGLVNSRMTATRVTRGAISLSSSSHFGLTPYSKFMNPVMLPPGRERLSTKPAATGSETSTNTIGTVRVAGCNAATIGVAAARMTSGARAANSAADLRISSGLPAVQRVSMRTLRPSVQPNPRSPCKNAVRRTCPSASSAASGISTPIRRAPSLCCARAASGHAAAPPMSVMNWRRLMSNMAFPPRGRRSLYRTLSMPQYGRQVFGADLNRSESERCPPCGYQKSATDTRGND
jgi:hypothetical protein